MKMFPTCFSKDGKKYKPFQSNGTPNEKWEQGKGAEKMWKGNTIRCWRGRA